MGVLQFLTRRLKKDKTPATALKGYFQLGPIRFSNDTYGFPIHLIHSTLNKTHSAFNKTIAIATKRLQVLGSMLQPIYTVLHSQRNEVKIATTALLTLLFLLFLYIWYTRAYPRKRRSVMIGETTVIPSKSSTEAAIQADVTLTEAQKTAFRLITTGTTMIKHGRSYTRDIRTVNVSPDLKSLQWRKIDDSRTVNSLPLASFAK